MGVWIRREARAILAQARVISLPGVEIWRRPDYVIRLDELKLQEVSEISNRRRRWLQSEPKKLEADAASLDSERADVTLTIAGRALEVVFRVSTPTDPGPWRSSKTACVEVDLTHLAAGSWSRMRFRDDILKLRRELTAEICERPSKRRWLFNAKAEQLRTQIAAIADQVPITREGSAYLVDCPAAGRAVDAAKRCVTCDYLAPSSREVLGAEPGILCLFRRKISCYDDWCCAR